MKKPLVKFTVITLFQEALAPYLNSSMLYKAQRNGIAEYEFINLRDYGIGRHKSVDDTPYGGGDGMLLRCEPVFAAIEEIKKDSPNAKVVLPTPGGRKWTQDYAMELAGYQRGDAKTRVPDKQQFHYIILCPHYEGYDARILSIVDYQVSLGHFILTGGELPALIIIDSVTRLLPGVLGGEQSTEIESFSDGDNIEFPQYTKPATFRGMKVPDVLLSGNHGEIAKWRKNHCSKAQD